MHDTIATNIKQILNPGFPPEWVTIEEFVRSLRDRAIRMGAIGKYA